MLHYLQGLQRLITHRWREAGTHQAWTSARLLALTQQVARSERRHGLIANVVDNELVTGVEQTPRHRPTHFAHSHKSERFDHRTSS